MAAGSFGPGLTVGPTRRCHQSVNLDQGHVPHLSMHTPVGEVTIFEDDGAIVALDWGWAGHDAADAPSDPRSRLVGNGSPLLHRARDQLDAYFDGTLRDFDLPLSPAGTDYRRRVWRALCEIPFGETRTYLDIARAAGGSPRSVGQANGSNPIPILIPCHRVVATTHLGGYSGAGGLDTKRWLLAHENPTASLL